MFKIVIIAVTVCVVVKWLLLTTVGVAELCTV